jgi:hypothetical protein
MSRSADRRKGCGCKLGCSSKNDLHIGYRNAAVTRTGPHEGDNLVGQPTGVAAEISLGENKNADLRSAPDATQQCASDACGGNSTAWLGQLGFTIKLTLALDQFVLDAV